MRDEREPHSGDSVESQSQSQRDSGNDFGNVVMEKAKELVRQGNAQRLTIRRPGGKALFDTTVTAGAGVTGVLTLLAPTLVAIIAIAALITGFSIAIRREDPRDETESDATNPPSRWRR